MTAIITNKFRIQRARQFKKEFDSSIDENYYLYVGETKPWSAPDSDDIPPVPVDNAQEIRKIWQSMLGLKKIDEIDVSHVIPRFNWEPNTVFASYSDDDPDLLNHPTEQEIIDANLGGYNAGPIYCVDSQFRVYKCLDNNGGAISTDTPSGTSLVPFSTSDGYVWKYMFTVSGPDILKFVTDDWIPVKLLEFDDGSNQWQVQQNAVSNQISNINVISPGSGLVDIADGAILSATSNSAVLDTGGNSFDNSYNQSTIHIVGGTGVGQQRVITSYDGTSKELTVSENFTVIPDATSTYEIRPSVLISGDGTGASAKAIVNMLGELESVQVTDSGTDYNFASATVVGGNIRLGGASPQVSVQIGPMGGHGANPVEELGGRFVMMNVKLDFNEGDGDFPTTNEYRRMGVIFDPKNFGTNDSATSTTLRATKQLLVSGVASNFLDDENISSLSASAFLVEAEDLGGGNFRITYIQTQNSGFNEFNVGETITGANSGATATIDSVINPEVEPYSGCIIYMQNQRPISRQILQLEDIKLTIAF